jgi:CBS-domain-containing membrane protein
MVLSILGVFLAMNVLIGLMYVLNDQAHPWLLMASMGASAIIVFATPHAPMAQPWAVIMGQMSSAVAGLLSWLWFASPQMAVPFAVAGALLAMLLLNCRHAPGGATALFIALGGLEVQTLGWSLLWLCILPSVLALVWVGVLFNAPFSWRRYPLWSRAKPVLSEIALSETINHADIEFASRQLKGYFEMSEAEFAALYQAARRHHNQHDNKTRK